MVLMTYFFICISLPGEKFLSNKTLTLVKKLLFALDFLIVILERYSCMTLVYLF